MQKKTTCSRMMKTIALAMCPMLAAFALAAGEASAPVGHAPPVNQAVSAAWEAHTTYSAPSAREAPALQSHLAFDSAQAAYAAPVAGGGVVADIGGITSIAGIGSFEDLPGATSGEIAAIKALGAERPAFVLGMADSSECFTTDGGALSGYGQLLCEWLTEFFGIRFELRAYPWSELILALKSGEADFTADFSPAAARAEGLLSTGVLSQRPLRAALLATGAAAGHLDRREQLDWRRQLGWRGQADSDSYSPLGGGQDGPLRVTFLDRSYDDTLVLPQIGIRYPGAFEAAYADSREGAVASLLAGSTDVFVADAALLAPASLEPGVVILDFAPLAFKEVAISTGDPLCAPVITAIDKAAAEGALVLLDGLAVEGEKLHRAHLFQKSLSPSERAHYDELALAGGVVEVGFNTSNYPICFYDWDSGSWDGLALDVLAAIAEITGLRFEAANSPDEVWPIVFQGLAEGRIKMIAELIRTPERDPQILWADNYYAADCYALVSKSSLDYLTPSQVLAARVGLLRDSAYAEMFRAWFPSYSDAVVFDSQIEGFDALDRHEIDLLMTTRNHYFAAINFLHRTDFRVNVLFGYESESTFGFARGEEELRGVISKALALVDVGVLEMRWNGRVFDYQGEIDRNLRISLAVLSVLLAAVIALASLQLFKWRSKKARLESLVAERTSELAAEAKAKEEASAAKSVFLASMSHEMRTPLNAIIGLSELALEPGAEDADRADKVGKVHNAGMTLLGIVNDILDISKIEAGKMEIAPAEYDVPSLVNDIVSQNILRIGERPIKFVLDVDEDLPSKLVGDELRVKQVFNNLLSNAFKYTREGTVEWRLDCERDGGNVWIVSRVSDTGVGIRPRDMQNLFTEYSQFDSNSRRSAEGTGLGLVITKRLAALMGGDVAAESRYGEGSSFTVRLRQRAAGDAVIGPSIADNLQRFTYSDGKRERNSMLLRELLPDARVLVVDDVDTNLDVARGMLKPYGMQVDCATSGAQAIIAVRSGQPRYDAIFMDHMMPGIDGVEATRSIREDIGTDYAMTVPIIALTANAIVGNEEMFLAKGFQAFLSKPIELAQLDAVIRKWVRRPSQ